MGQSRRHLHHVGVVAAPSEGFTWKLFGNPDRRCWKCGKEPLRVQDVGEHRRKYPGGKDEFLCKDCRNAALARAVEAHRRAAGLESKP